MLKYNSVVISSDHVILSSHHLLSQHITTFMLALFLAEMKHNIFNLLQDDTIKIQSKLQVRLLHLKATMHSRLVTKATL